MGTQKINALDLFAGAGGLSLGMEMAGINIIAAVEFDNKIARTYKFNHPATIMINEDIRNIPADKNDSVYRPGKKSIKDIFSQKGKSVDMIIGGPPCQGFSMAGSRIRHAKSFFEDKRNLLFLEFVRMVRILRPKIFVLENVPGILNFNHGSVQKEIKEKFSQLGYNVKASILSAEKFGVPQKRKRAIFIGNNLGMDSTKLFPHPFTTPENEVTVWDAISDLPSLEAGTGKEPETYRMLAQNSYQKIMRNTKNNMFYNHVAANHKQTTLNILKKIKPGQTMKNLPTRLQTKSVHSGAYGRMKKMSLAIHSPQD